MGLISSRVEKEEERGMQRGETTLKLFIFDLITIAICTLKSFASPCLN